MCELSACQGVSSQLTWCLVRFSKLANDKLRITMSFESIAKRGGAQSNGRELLSDSEAFSLPIGSMKGRYCAMFLQSLNVHLVTL
jgi:hypothetical protein